MWRLTNVCLLFALVFCVRTSWGQASHGVAEQYLFAAANAERAQHGLTPLHWDEALYRAASDHARVMAEHGTIGHQYTGEPELAARAQAAGVRFSAVLENVGAAPTALELHNAWMNSAHHRENLLNPQADAVAIAVARRGGQLYAVEDFTHSIAALPLDAQEAAVSSVLAAYPGVELIPGNEAARATCRTDQGYAGDRQPRFVMRYTTGDLTHIPAELKAKLQSGQVRQAAVGACTPMASSPFTMYALTVLLYP